MKFRSTFPANAFTIARFGTVMDDESVESIPRTLEEGWHFRPDWRRRVVDAYLTKALPDVETGIVIQGEADSYVRQYFHFRRTARCMNQPAFAWAHQCMANNRATGAASLIKALTIARVPVKEIAAKLRTKPRNILVFMKLFFDIAPYLGEREWMASLVFPSTNGTPDLAEFRERHWLTAAFLRGRHGLNQALSRKVTLTPEERDEKVSEIRSALSTRAFDYVTSLQHGFVPPGPEDLDRLLRVLDVANRQPERDASNELMNTFIKGIHQDLVEKSRKEEFADNPVLSMLREASDQAKAEIAAEEINVEAGSKSF
jgi:hypothetical protein